MIAVDTNILVYAHREDSPWHEAACSRLSALAEGAARWAIPWPCLHEFLGIVTHPKVYRPPTSLPVATDQVTAWLESPTVVLLSEPEQCWPTLRDLLSEARVAGALVHDAKIAALCQVHGVRELWTADRDFGRFPTLRAINPLISPTK